MDQLGLSIRALPQPIPMAGVTGKYITRITHEAVQVQLISGNHRELGEFMVFHSPMPQLILFPLVM